MKKLAESMMEVSEFKMEAGIQPNAYLMEEL